MNTSIWRRLFAHPFRTYLTAFLIGLAITLVMLFTRGHESMILCSDAFGTAGLVVILIGLAVLVVGLGAFDSLAYGFSSFVKNRRYHDLYEYTTAKAEKRSRKGYTFVPFILSGMFYLIVSAVLHILI